MALLVAVPVLVGSLGRVLVGALTDRHGGRLMFPLVTVATLVPVLSLAFSAITPTPCLLFGGFFLGIGGTAFAVGVPFVNAWFPPERRASPSASSARAWAAPPSARSPRSSSSTNAAQRAVPDHRRRAGGLRRGCLAGAAGRARPRRTHDQPGHRLAANSRLPITWQACILYAVAFGGYVAFSVYLPAYLKTAHGLTPPDAANRMAGFVVVAVIMRPVGGWLSDKFGAIPVLTGSSRWWRSAPEWPRAPRHWRVGTVAFLAMAAALGAGSGATFALVASATEPGRVGGVTGLVGAAGGLGGFVPPLIMGYVYGQTDSYAIGLWLLAATAALTLLT